MWSTTLSFTSSISNPFPILRYSHFKSPNFSLKLKASTSFSQFPLASRLFVTNLPYSTSERSLLEHFSHFGQIAEVKIVKDNETRRSKGFAFIQFTSQDEAMLAIETMDRQKLDGRVIFVQIAKPGRDAFGGSLRTSGPPKERPRLPQQEEEADCWY